MLTAQGFIQKAMQFALNLITRGLSVKKGHDNLRRLPRPEEIVLVKIGYVGSGFIQQNASHKGR